MLVLARVRRQYRRQPRPALIGIDLVLPGCRKCLRDRHILRGRARVAIGEYRQVRPQARQQVCCHADYGTESSGLANGAPDGA